eukprot:TRINITY_DN18693_c0_g1_i4.p1 TRINITY_DN18693_c0_g1~~TRINITY_DN18693_c0_g1_i4.p1  ORF type:complete len:452 (-),score=170.50 TRINITY_DN18693_c0_g1_i4:340-1695(-)
MAFASIADSLARDQYPDELKKVLGIMERNAGGRGHQGSEMWTMRCVRMLENFYKRHIGAQANESSNLSSQLDTLKTQLQKKNQQIERYAAERAELEKRVGDYPQACAALEKQLKFATDRIERADEEKKELQEVLRAWEAENLRLRTQVVKLMEQQVKSAALEAQAHQTEMKHQKEQAALRRQLKGNNKQNVQRRLHLTNSHKSLREEKRKWLEEREHIHGKLAEDQEQVTQLQLQLAQLEAEHRALLLDKDKADTDRLQLRQTLASMEAEAASQRSDAIRARKEGHESLMRERDEWRLKCEGIPMSKERKEELIVTNRNLRAERDELKHKHEALAGQLKQKEADLKATETRNADMYKDCSQKLQTQRYIQMDFDHLKQANMELVDQIKIAHDSEERALDAKAGLEKERDSLQQQVNQLEQDRITARTKLAMERQSLLKEVAEKQRIQAWRD